MDHDPYRIFHSGLAISQLRRYRQLRFRVRFGVRFRETD